MQSLFAQNARSLRALTAALLAGLALAGCEAGSEGDSESTAEVVGAAGAASTKANALFAESQPWTRDVSGSEKSPSSDSIVGWLSDHGGWGTSRLRIEFSIKVLQANDSTPFLNFEPSEDFYSPDCDRVPFPVPHGGALEDEAGYECTTDGDCHLLVVHPGRRRLYEMWRANIKDGVFAGGCGAVWDLDGAYERGRGDNCTSADAGGFPVAPMVFTADEIAKGSIDHAIRFILPNNRIRRGVYVAPATHASTVLTGGADAPPYGVRLRLRQDFPLDSLPTEGARVIARAMQRYGMILADGGRVPLTAADDRFTEHKWEEVGVGPDSVGGIRVTDMEVVEMGEPIEATGECVRN